MRLLLLWLNCSALLLFCHPVHAQSAITVKGTVIHKNGDPIPGATVIVKGTSKGVSTRADGTFQIEAPPNAILVISNVGYVTQEIKLTGLNVAAISVQLTASRNEFEQVV